MNTEIRIFILCNDLNFAHSIEENIVDINLGNVSVFYEKENMVENLYQSPKIVIIDYQIANNSGIEALRKIKSINPNIQVIIVSSVKKIPIAVEALKYGAYDYIVKNDTSIFLIKASIKKILKFEEIVLKQRKSKRIKKMVFISSITIATILAIIAVRLA